MQWSIKNMQEYKSMRLKNAAAWPRRLGKNKKGDYFNKDSGVRLSDSISLK